MFKNAKEFVQYANKLKTLREKKLNGVSIYVCVGTGCTAKGALKVYSAFEEELKKRNLLGQVTLEKIDDDKVTLNRTGCCGRCSSGPLVKIMPYRFFYSNVVPEDVPEIVDRTVLKGEPIERLFLTDPLTGEKVPRIEDTTLFKNQDFYIMEAIGESECDSIEDYIARGGYESLVKALTSMTPEEIIETVKASGLRGRGGGGFPTGLKWEFTRKAQGDIKFVVCNGDEGDPDRKSVV